MSARATSEEAATKVFTALADPTRRLVLERLGRLESATATALARDLTVTRQAVLKHLTVLADAGLVESRRDGREVLFTVRPEHLRSTAAWLVARADAWQDRLDALRSAAESRAGRGR
ncbi:ArsR family transcriptional regulator [Knoellia remsis]|uniref:ArsR family transcriptional regulator n=1 Tax=Knoellia remsis TaxID=407159 RepID=A0A2T0UZR7_9MICO|nr:metalloregulator ArsR/SmtB family transcription factor [Knoellia remsis]PRY63394.1 ArsR family transcriptional regulator [Knoellia remsis]